MSDWRVAGYSIQPRVSINEDDSGSHESLTPVTENQFEDGYESYNSVSISKFNRERGTMSARRSKRGPEERPTFGPRTSKKCTRFGKWKIGDYFNLSTNNLVCNKCEDKAWLRQKCNACDKSGARNVRLISGMHMLCTVCAAVRYQMEVESLQEMRSPSEGSATRKRRVNRGLNQEHPVSGRRPKSVDDAVFIATLNTMEQLLMLCTPFGSIQELGRPEKKPRHRK